MSKRVVEYVVHGKNIPYDRVKYTTVSVTINGMRKNVVIRFRLMSVVNWKKMHRNLSPSTIVNDDERN